MADNQNAKNAIEEYLNALLLDDYQAEEVAGVEAKEETSATQVKAEDTVHLEKNQTLAQEQEKTSADFSFQVEADTADEIKATGALADDFEQNLQPEQEKPFVTSEQISQPAELTTQRQEQKPVEKESAFAVKEENKNWLGQSLLMPKLRLATGEEVVAKTGTDKNLQFNPSDFNRPPPPANWDNGRPEWGQNRFDCLLFKVMGLTLAVPLVELGGILRIEEAPKALFGQPDWFLGLMRANDENVYLVDTAKWVLPQSLIEKQEGEAYEFVIKIHNSSWGLCSNKVAEAISLNPDQVKWRSAGSKRPWLAGTVIKEMCALIDVAAFAQLLESGHGNMRPVNLAEAKKQD